MKTQKFHRYLCRLLATACLLLVGGTGIVRAQADVEFDIDAPLKAAEGQPFKIAFTGSTQKRDISDARFSLPDIGGLSVISGPVRSVGVFMSDVNGVSQTRNTVTYTYWVKAERTGKIDIPAATVTVGGETYKTRPTAIESLSAEQAHQQSGSSGAGGGNASDAGFEPVGKTRLASDDILLRIEVDKTDVYRGEPVVASLRIYTQVNIAGFENIKYPALNGFWAQEMDLSGQGDSRATLGGKVYHTQILRQWLLYPQRTGTIEIEQAQFTAIAQLVTQMPATGSPYDLFYGGAPQIKNVSARLVSPVVKIRVKELPRPQPDDFTGAVGQFELTGVATGDRFAANTAGSITLRLSGTGNFPLVEAPRITLPAAFEQFDMKTNERLVNTARGTTGEKTFEYPFIARAEGDYTIPGVRFSYFDPSTGKYNTLTTPDFPIRILRDEGNGASGLGMVSGVTKEDLQMLGSDIRFIRMGDPRLVRQGGAFLWSWGWFATAFVLAAAFVGLLVYLQKSIRERADIVRVKTKKANKVALRRLKRAKGYMNAGKESAFFEELLRALWGYMGDKLAIDVANLTKERVLGELVGRRGMDEEQAREFLNLISECEFAQYSPAAGVPMDKAYNAALDLIGRFENKI